jgi:O-antigen ligase
MITDSVNTIPSRIISFAYNSKISKIFIFIYLSGNILSRLYAVSYHGLAIAVLSLFLLGVCFFLSIFPEYLKISFFLFGVSFILFGFRPYDIESQVFEYIISLLSLTLYGNHLRSKGPLNINKNLTVLFLCYIILSTLSLLLFNLNHLIKNYYCFGLETFLLHIYNAMPSSNIYSFAGINRLVLFFIFIFYLSINNNARDHYKTFFAGLFTGAVLAAIIGIFDYYGFISIAKYRHNFTTNELQSTFINRGWFAEFIVVSVPFVLIGFIYSHKKTWIWKSGLFFLLVICEIAIILSGSRTGWVVYPLVLFMCWLFFYFLNDNGTISFNRIFSKELLKVVISVPITIVISFVLIFKLILPIAHHFKEYSKKTDYKDPGISEQIIRKQASRLIEPSGRFEVWEHGLNVAIERPLLGMGYESFSWHGNILTNIPNSSYSRNTNRLVQDTPHNTFLQLVINGGLVGLTLWLVIVFYSMTILILDVKKNNNLFAIAVIISIISFHTIGILQSMQYVPMIWALIFMNFGYAMTVQEDVLSLKHNRLWNRISIITGVIVILSGIFYYYNPLSETLKVKYALKTYDTDQLKEKFSGFYELENWPNGEYRWSGKKAIMHCRAETNFIGLNIHAHPFNSLSPDGLKLKLNANGKNLDEISFFDGGDIKKFYFIPAIQDNDIQIQFDAGKTFNPFKIGLSEDLRNLGVAVGPIEFINVIPEDGLGFHHWESWNGDSPPGWPLNLPVKFRWTGMRASMKVSDIRGGQRLDDTDVEKSNVKPQEEFQLYFMCAHPDILKNDVYLSILCDDKIIGKIIFRNNLWQRFIIRTKELGSSSILTFQVSRTWNPKSSGVSEDRRDLGAAIAILGN